jgi:hypothetical protein
MPLEITKAAPERMYSLAPWSIPGDDTAGSYRDAHKEYATADELAKALHAYMRQPDHQVRWQHRKDGPILGEVVEAVQWPWEVRTNLITFDGEVAKAARPVVFPPDTCFVGVQWNKIGWRLLKADKIRGMSVGGSGRRTRVGADVDEADVRKALEREGLNDAAEADGDDAEELAAPPTFGTPKFAYRRVPLDEGESETGETGVPVTVDRLSKSADSARHRFTAGPAGRCLWCSHSAAFHDSIAKGLPRPHNRASNFQAPLQITDAASLLAALEKLPTLRDQGEGRR